MDSFVPSVPELLPARNPEIEVAEFDFEFVVFDPRNSMVYRLGGAEAVVFDACDGALRSDDLMREMVESGLGEPDAVMSLIGAVVAALGANGLFEGTAGPLSPPPCIDCRGRRRRRRFLDR